jgi:hypothetical protein
MYTDLVIEKYEEFCQLFSSDENVKMLVEDYVEVMYDLYMDNFEDFGNIRDHADSINSRCDLYMDNFEDFGNIRDHADSINSRCRSGSVETIFKFFLNSKNQFWRSITLDEFLFIYERFINMRTVYKNGENCSYIFVTSLGQFLQTVVHFKVLRELSDLKKNVKLKEDIVPQINLIDL